MQTLNLTLNPARTISVRNLHRTLILNLTLTLILKSTKTISAQNLSQTQTLTLTPQSQSPAQNHLPV